MLVFSVELGLNERMWMDKFLSLITVMGKVGPFSGLKR